MLESALLYYSIQFIDTEKSVKKIFENSREFSIYFFENMYCTNQGFYKRLRGFSRYLFNRTLFFGNITFYLDKNDFFK